MWDPTGPYYGSDFVKEELERLIDHMGAQAAKCQGLDFPLTSSDMFLNTPQRIYVLKFPRIFNMKGAILGFVRTGWRTMDITDHEGFIRKLDMLVLYDIYVARKFRRLGHARKLLDFISRHEGVPMHHMVLDQPSPALLELFMKYYYLRDFVTVETRYTVWKRFMDEQRPASKIGVRHLNTGHTYTTNPRNYLGGPWPISSSVGTNVEHPYVNWHPPTAAVPGYHYELSPEKERVYNNRFYRHDNRDKAKALHKMRISHHPFVWT